MFEVKSTVSAKDREITDVPIVCTNAGLMWYPRSVMTYGFPDAANKFAVVTVGVPTS
jgi:hypothetical protein